jgi:hypothetical protein
MICSSKSAEKRGGGNLFGHYFTWMGCSKTYGMSGGKRWHFRCNQFNLGNLPKLKFFPVVQIIPKNV